MPAKTIAMSKIERIMRLSHEASRSQSEIARACGLSQPAVQRVLKRAPSGAQATQEVQARDAGEAAAGGLRGPMALTLARLDRSFLANFEDVEGE